MMYDAPPMFKDQAHPFPASGLRLFGWQHGHMRQLAVFIIEVEAIADHEHIGDVEAAVIGLQGNLLPSAFAQEDTDAQGGHAQAPQMLNEVAEGLPGIENIVKQKNVLAT